MTDQQLTRRNSDHIMHERIKALEVKQDIIHKDLKEHIQKEDKDRVDLLSCIQEVKENQQKMKGFVAGVSATVSAIVIAIGMALKWFQN